MAKPSGKEGPVWRAGIYARLSVDGNEKKNESIDTQIEIAKKYLRQIEDAELAACYTDLGKTGTNFKREGFERMMEDIRQKKINCVAVKDFSRFGRNYIETGNYMEKIFPFLKVRFIAVTDGYDSERITGGQFQLSVNLKNIVNELYARDISQKVRSVKQLKQEKGSYIGGAPPYGYRAKKVGDKRILFPDEAARQIVVKIFEMYADGKTCREIADELYQKKIQRPWAYNTTGKIYCPKDQMLQQWSYDTIKNILMNPVYTGTFFQPGDDKKTHGSPKDRESHSLAAAHTHEPLISEELFRRVSQRFQSQKKYGNRRGFSETITPKEDVFKGMIFCGGCGSLMVRQSSIKIRSGGERVRRYSYACPNKNKIGNMACSSQRISLSALETIVKTLMEKECSCFEFCLEDDWKETMQEAVKKKAGIRTRIREAKQKQEQLTWMGSQLYRRFHEGEISREVFLEEKSKIEKELEKWNRRETDFRRQEEMTEQEAEKRKQSISELLTGGADTEPDRQMAECLIQKINVYPKGWIEILWNYRKNELLERMTE